MADEIVNRVERSGIVTVDLEEFLPHDPVEEVDIAPWLWQGIALQEKSFREAVESHDWEAYSGKAVAVTCSADAIIPTWAYMLIAVALEPYASRTAFGTRSELREKQLVDTIYDLPLEPYTDRRVVIKGCGDKDIPTSAYLAITAHLKPVVRSLLFGEPCSTVPVYRKPRKAPPST